VSTPTCFAGRCQAVDDKVRVLFITGTGRAGSTLVGNLLASTPGVVDVGELRHFWTRGIGENWTCGCGNRFDTCPFWSAVIKEAFGGVDRIDLIRLRASERSLLRLRASPRALRWIRDSRLMPIDFDYYVMATERLYSAVAKVSEAEIIVDSSKNPTYGALLSIIPTVDLRVLHLLRDPRATAYSWLNPKPSPDRGIGATMDRIGPAKSAALWTWWNTVAGALWAMRSDVPSMRIRYETLTKDPEGVLRSVRSRLAPEVADRSIGVEGHIGNVGISHTVSGNPDRMRTGEVAVLPDDRWRSGLAGRHRATVVAVAGVAMLRYGYFGSALKRQIGRNP
jgi:sulfotransferase family protein